MTGYKDKTFCVSPNCTNECGSRLTKEIIQDAWKWYGSQDAPISIACLCDKSNKSLQELFANILIEDDITRYQRTKDIALRNKIIEEHIPFVQIQAKMYLQKNPNAVYDDLVQVGTLGLMKALERYNPQEEAKFSTYAYSDVLGSMYELVQSEVDAYEKPPVVYVEPEDLRQKGACIDWDPTKEIFKKQNKKRIRELINTLKPRDRAILIKRYYKDQTLKQIAHSLGISKQRVKQLEDKILEKLRKELQNQ